MDTCRRLGYGLAGVIIAGTTDILKDFSSVNMNTYIYFFKNLKVVDLNLSHFTMDLTGTLYSRSTSVSYYF